MRFSMATAAQNGVHSVLVIGHSVCSRDLNIHVISLDQHLLLQSSAAMEDIDASRQPVKVEFRSATLMSLEIHISSHSP